VALRVIDVRATINQAAFRSKQPAGWQIDIQETMRAVASMIKGAGSANSSINGCG
jgi:hypothetical protein